MLSSLGYQADFASSGNKAIRLAIASADYEVAFIDTTIGDPPIVLLLQQLRNDCRTAGLRIGLLARSGRLEQAEHLARDNSLCLAFSRPHTREAVEWQLRQLAALAPRDFVPLAERRAQAAGALAALAAMASSSGKVYDVGRAKDALLAALNSQEFAAPATKALAHVASPEAQRALVDAASRPGRPIDARRAAAAAFAANAKRFGLLLTKQEIRRQYDRYDRSGSEDPAAQRVYSAILDAVEASAQRAESSQPLKDQGH